MEKILYLIFVRKNNSRTQTLVKELAIGMKQRSCKKYSSVREKRFQFNINNKFSDMIPD